MKSPMLARDYDASALSFPVFASPKIDGIRCHIVNGIAYSRSGKPIKNRYVQQIIGNPLLNGCDGELVVGGMNEPDVYNKTSSGVMASGGWPDFKFVVFDNYSDPDHPYEDRLCFAQELIGDGLEKVELLSQTLINCEEDLAAFEAAAIENGFEGVMIRNPKAPYKFGRSTVKEGYLLKIKRFSHDEATIIGFEELMHNGNESSVDELGRTKRSSAKDGLYGSGMLGAYVVESPKWPKPFNVSCGSMSHDEKRLALLKASEDLGKLIRFKHLEHGAKDVPRHPLFAGFRSLDDL